MSSIPSGERTCGKKKPEFDVGAVPVFSEQQMSRMKR